MVPFLSVNLISQSIEFRGKAGVRKGWVATTMGPRGAIEGIGLLACMRSTPRRTAGNLQQSTDCTRRLFVDFLIWIYDIPEAAIQTELGRCVGSTILT